MMQSNQELAAWGEAQAGEFLEQQGYRVIARNFRSKYGEIDLIVRREPPPEEPDRAHMQPLVLFVEVKTRRSLSFGFPEQAVTPNKRRHILAAAEEYIQLHPEMTGDWRVDVISILCQGTNTSPEISHFENAISAEG